MRDCRKINAWRLADELTVSIYRKTKSFPPEEQYGLTSQMRRAAYSVPANIAEGSARPSNKDYLHFLHMARSSLTEAQYFVHLSRRLGYLDEESAGLLESQVKNTFVRLHGLIEAVARETQPCGRRTEVGKP